MFLCEILTEQQQAFSKVSKPMVNEDQSKSEDEYDEDLDDVQEAPAFQEILPIKKYYLINRLKELKSRLDQHNIQNEDFNIITKFLNNFSYNSLLSLANGIIPVVEDQLARLPRND